MKPGDKVVCVDDSPCKCHCHLGEPVIHIAKGIVYTVEFDQGPGADEGIVLIGVRDNRHRLNYGYNHFRFRKLDELKAEARLRQSQKQPA